MTKEEVYFQCYECVDQNGKHRMAATVLDPVYIAFEKEIDALKKSVAYWKLSFKKQCQATGFSEEYKRGWRDRTQQSDLEHK